MSDYYSQLRNEYSGPLSSRSKMFREDNYRESEYEKSVKKEPENKKSVKKNKWIPKNGETCVFFDDFNLKNRIVSQLNNHCDPKITNRYQAVNGVGYEHIAKLTPENSKYLTLGFEEFLKHSEVK